jgi:hypothetical protein
MRFLVADLVERFERDRKAFQSPDYKEEQLRAEFGQRTCRLRFLNPFFESLGWDMDNKQGLSGFSVLPADILGQVYEQFLGKVIRLTAGHRAKVEEKPEVRKAGELRPARLTNVCRRPKMQPMSAHGRLALTGMELIIMSPELLS